jgi:hypothetical protein
MNDEHAIAPWDETNPLPIWMRITDPRNQPKPFSFKKKSAVYRFTDEGGNHEDMATTVEINDRFHVGWKTIKDGLQRGFIFLEGKLLKCEMIEA